MPFSSTVGSGRVAIRWSGGVAVITGAGSGIGRSLALALAEAGMDVVVTGRRRDRLDEVADTIRAAGGRPLPYVVDVAVLDEVMALADHVRDVYGRVDVLALNAGVTSAGPLVDHTPQDWRWIFDVNVFGVVNALSAFMRGMFEAGSGHILITGSQMGITPDFAEGHGPYVAAKAALTGLAVSLQPEAEQHGVGVSLLIPGYTVTDLGGSNDGRPSILAGQFADRKAPTPARDIRLPKDPAARVALTPAEVAARAIAGMEHNDLFIATHPSLRPYVERYAQRLVAPYDADPADEQAGPIAR